MTSSSKSGSKKTKPSLKTSSSKESEAHPRKLLTRSADGSMGFLEHIDELRARLITCVWVFTLGFIGSYLIAEHLLEILRRPLFAVLPLDQQKLHYLSLFENFMAHLKISAVGSFFFFSPFYFYQIWAFIAPGLYPRERKYVFPFVFAATLFFVGGALFAYFVLFPTAFHFFVTYGGPQDMAMLTIDSYYTTVLKLLVLFGLAFELPVLISFLGFLGIIDAAFLKQHRQSAIIGITVLSALFAPPDALSMIILGVPLVLLYEISIWVVQWLGVKRKRERPQSSSSDEENNDPWVGKSR